MTDCYANCFRSLVDAWKLKWRLFWLTKADGAVEFDVFCHRDRVGISKTELVSMLEEEELKDAVLVVLANKQVLPQHLFKKLF